jgi:biopolymer transport protein ExbD
MLVGRMDATAPFEVLPPVARSGSDMPGGGVTVSIAADGRLALDGVGRERAALLDALAEALREAPEVLVRINADRGAELRRVLPLVGEIEALGAREVVLVLTPAAP